jgi:16S rRNA G966 N2-methylase RsmD
MEVHDNIIIFYKNLLELNLNNFEYFKYFIYNDNEYLYNLESNNDNLNIKENNFDTDAWEDAINDNKFYINNRIARIFPIIKNFNNYGKIKIDDDSFSYITIREVADFISKIISHHLLQFNVNSQKSTIIDYTAGVGGNVLSFGKFFNKVYAIELSKLRAEYLQNNINVYCFKNINVINDSAVLFNENQMITINPNVIFVDPPWGGIDYKNSESLQLKLGETTIEDLIINIIEKFSDYYTNHLNLIEDNEIKIKLDNNNNNNKLIVLKLPKNYNIEYFYNFLKKNNKVNNYMLNTFLYILNKMLIVVIELTYISSVF